MCAGQWTALRSVHGGPKPPRQAEFVPLCTHRATRRPRPCHRDGARVGRWRPGAGGCLRRARWAERPGVAPGSSATRFGAGDGVIPDAATAVDSPRRVSTSSSQASDVLRLVGSFPTATWGRDEQQAGEMWNSNSLTAWLLALSRHDIESTALQPPRGGRAPGWSAGLVVAARAGADQACLSEGGLAGWTDQSGGSSLPDSSSRSASVAVA